MWNGREKCRVAADLSSVKKFDVGNDEGVYVYIFVETHSSTLFLYFSDYCFYGLFFLKDCCKFFRRIDNMERGCKMSSVLSDLSFAKKFDLWGNYSSRFFISLSLSSLDSFINVHSFVKLVASFFEQIWKKNEQHRILSDLISTMKNYISSICYIFCSNLISLNTPVSGSVLSNKTYTRKTHILQKFRSIK